MFDPFSFVKHRDLPNFTPLFGNIGRDWNNPLPNDLFIKGVPKSVHRTLNTTGIGNIGVGLDLLHEFTLPANSLKSNGDYLDVFYAGRYANTEADKQLRLRIDSQLIISFGAVIDLENGAWTVQFRIYRTTSTQVMWAGLDMHVQSRRADGAIITTPSGAFHVPRNDFATVANLNTSPVVIDVYGEGTADNDVFLRVADISITRF